MDCGGGPAAGTIAAAIAAFFAGVNGLVLAVMAHRNGQGRRGEIDRRSGEHRVVKLPPRD